MGDLPRELLRSSRAKVLKRVVDYINAQDFEDGRSYPFMIFGKRAFEDWLEQPSGEPDSDNQAIRKIASDLKKQRGTAVAYERTSLTPPPSQLLRGVEDLSPEGLDAIRQLATTGRAVAKVDAIRQESQKIDELDAHYANEVLEKLDGILSRVCDFERFEPSVRNPKVQKYFEEAHQLYLYGFRIATAVLCRAILDSALEDLVGAQATMGPTKNKPGVSSLLLKGAEKGLFGNDERDKADGVEAAAWVREAGNCAIHEMPKFDSEYAGHKIAEVISVTRGLLNKMYESHRLQGADEPPRH